jgi:hypothetical protein
MRRPRPALRVTAAAALVALFGLTGCVGDPEPAQTPITPVQACAALEGAVTEYYESTSPGSSVEQLRPYDLPDVNGFHIPKPDCAFQVTPDPEVIPGDVFTIESFYLDYDEEMTLSLPAQIEAAGFVRKNAEFPSWAVNKLGRSYSAAMLLFSPDDGQAYSEAAEHFRILDLSIGQN